ncbi:MAG TPA: hypothetical protein VFG69_00695, partial [Nannocystaceae bacterium]|nr:hypothetical protein [Nannocystaceae bacterium]
MNRTTAPWTHWIIELRAACLPFVSRSLRGPRLKRSLALSLVLALATCIVGGWIALGDGDFERETRQALRLEKSAQQRGYEDFVMFAYDERTLHRLENERDDLLAGRPLENVHGELRNHVAQAYDTVQSALNVRTVPRQHQDLYASALAIDERHPEWQERIVVGRGSGFDWYRPRDIARLQAIVDRDLVPDVALYDSPLGPREAVGLVGLFAGLLSTLLLLVVVPVLVGIAVAQESHENTLQPLCGTSLSPRQIALGLVVGAAAPVLI